MRRGWPCRVILAVATVVLAGCLGGTASRPVTSPVEVYRIATCRCCRAYEDYLTAAGFTVRDHVVPELESVHAPLGWPAHLRACHVARLGAYTLEGHVPTADIRRLLREHSTAKGLAVVGMPVGAPGMEKADTEPFDVQRVEHDDEIVVQAHYGADAKELQRRAPAPKLAP